jgi:hypothetical protein
MRGVKGSGVVNESKRIVPSRGFRLVCPGSSVYKLYLADSALKVFDA